MLKKKFSFKRNLPLSNFQTLPFSAQNAAAVAAMFSGSGALPQHLMHCASITAPNYTRTAQQLQHLDSTTTKITTNQEQQISTTVGNLAANIRFANMCQFFPSTQQQLLSNDRKFISDAFLSMFRLPAPPPLLPQLPPTSILINNKDNFLNDTDDFKKTTKNKEKNLKENECF